jgi:hypothetical protein
VVTEVIAGSASSAAELGQHVWRKDVDVTYEVIKSLYKIYWYPVVPPFSSAQN